MILYRTTDGIFVEHDNKLYPVNAPSFDLLVSRDDLLGFLTSIVDDGTSAEQIDQKTLQAPIGSQEVWAAGVTYYRSRSARIEE